MYRNSAVLGLLLAAISAVELGMPCAQAEDARVLPAGRSRFGLVYARTTGITETFDASGHAELLTAPYNIDLSSGNLRSFDPEIANLVDLLNKFKNFHYNYAKRDNGRYGMTDDPNDPTLGDALSRGFLSVDAEGKHTEWNFSLQHGVTDRLSVGFAVPYAKNTVTVAHALTGANTADDIYNGFLSKNPGYSQSSYDELKGGLDKLRSANDETLQQLLVSKGYQRFESYEGSGLGDIVGGGRYMYHNAHHASGDWIASAQAGVTVPTGALRPPSALTQLDFGQGCWDLGIANLVNYSPWRWLMLSNGMHYTYRFKGSRVMRVRKNPDEFIPDASDEEEVSMRLGDKWWLTFGGDIKLTDAITLSTSYEWFWKAKDQFSGSRTDRDYTYLSDDTLKYQETWQVGASISSIPSFLRHEFPAPLDLGISLNLPRGGKNTPIAPYGIAQLGLYF